MSNRPCEVCGRTPSEEHHIIKRSQAPYLINIKLNIKDLCHEHHRGNEGPELNRRTDKKYKLEYQDKVMALFDMTKYYTEKDIREKLNTTQTEVRKFLKILPLHKEGYLGEDIVRRMMGGRCYV